jgi:hypothetical protein
VTLIRKHDVLIRKRFGVKEAWQGPLTYGPVADKKTERDFDKVQSDISDLNHWLKEARRFVGDEEQAQKMISALNEADQAASDILAGIHAMLTNLEKQHREY